MATESAGYEPRTGRFLSEDPIGLSGGINPYVFADDDPVNGRDPTGLCALYLITFIDLNGNNMVDEGEVLSWECFFGGIDETEGGSGGDSGQRGQTECQRLADVAGQTAASSTSVDLFAVRLGMVVASVDGTSASLGTGGQDLLNPTGSLPGGFRPELGGHTTGQARHFAATVASVARYGNTFAWLGWYRNEHFGTPGASSEDWNVSRAAFSLMRDLRPGYRGKMPVDPALRMSGGAVRQWFLSNLCVQ